MSGSVIVGSARTPIGKLSGAFVDSTAMDLGGVAIKAALERAGVGPEQVADAVVGDAGLRARFTALIDPLRFPEDGLVEDDVVEVRRIKARVDDERLPRGADPNTHLKLGRGGLADVEWTVQLLQMQHAGRVPGLRTPQTLAALHAAAEAELISTSDAETLAQAWRLVSRVRNAVTLVRGKVADHLPSDALTRAAVARVLGYPAGESDRMVNDYLRTTRRAHSVVERLFWG